MRTSWLILFVFTGLIFLTSAKPEKDWYNERYRPQFHFTPEKNWQNDPNGLVYYDGEYHLFYQYNPNGTDWGFMHWGHAVSKDLIRWQHLPIAIYPDENSTDKEKCTAFSGSAIVDDKNILGKQNGDIKTLVAFYTSQFCGQRMAYSTDRGRTWTKYENNPVIAYDENDDARDPKVFWHEETGKWVMVLYRKPTPDTKSKGVSIYTSSNLVNWEFKSHIAGFYECPDLIKLKVTNRPDEFKWILFDGDGSYLIGEFNGEKFIPETPKLPGDYGLNYYATQTWSNIPATDGRTIQIAWMKGGKFIGMPFNGQMSFPCELSLTKFNFGYKLIRKPVSEIEKLHNKNYKWQNENLIPGLNKNILKGINSELLHIKGEFDIKTSDNFGFMIRNGKKDAGTELLYNVKRGVLSILGVAVPLNPVDNKISLEIVIDRASVEVFANGGQTVISNCFNPDDNSKDILFFTNGGELLITKMEVSEMNSAWRTEEKKEKETKNKK